MLHQIGRFAKTKAILAPHKRYKYALAILIVKLYTFESDTTPFLTWGCPLKMHLKSIAIFFSTRGYLNPSLQLAENQISFSYTLKKGGGPQPPLQIFVHYF